MASFQSKIAVNLFKLSDFLSPPNATLQQQRSRMDMADRLLKVHREVQVTKVYVGSVPAEWSVPQGAPSDRCLLYIHGGAWCMGSPRSHRGLVSYLAYGSGMRSLSIDYRLAPEHPFPAGLDDCILAFRWLLDNGFSPGKLAVAGDSAGGNLTLALLVALRDQGLPLPAAAVALSPATDLTGSGESLLTRRHLDPVLTSLGSSVVTDYITSHDPRHPYISPLFADLHGLPPILIHVGDHEVLLDDAVRFGQRACEAGVDARAVVWPGMFHVFQVFVPFMPEARQSVQQIADFIRSKLG